ncbi:MAG: hypothetical protein KKC80_06000 [Candidatus Margulisbacteria bacterium]|nr:hypothetical protein [Candidatus Margulisiibacteriota bacterium]MBU1616169.1 hypothetical protein [Candidatus Margulisiibacteriota bacterium]
MIDPSRDCGVYPADKIKDEVIVSYADGTGELSYEREKVLGYLSQIDYRFTQGIKQVVIVEQADCPTGTSLIGSSYQPYSSGIISLCRDPANGFLGNNDFGDNEILMNINRAVGYHVWSKLDEPTRADYQRVNRANIDLYSEADRERAVVYLFARGFLNNLLARPYLRLDNEREDDYGFFNYEWYRDNLFCGGEAEKLIDPTTSCEPLGDQGTKVLYELGVNEQPGEREEIERALSLIDPRYKQGVKLVRVAESGICGSGAYYTTEAIALCREIGPDGQSTFEHLAPGLADVLAHELGHNVDYLLGQGKRRQEIYEIFGSPFPQESFAEHFRMFMLGGEYYLTVTTDPISLQAFYWIRNILNCGVVPEDMICYYHLQLGQHYLFAQLDCPRAIATFKEARARFPDDTSCQEQIGELLETAQNPYGVCRDQQ